jgi:hypothetical protein
MALPKKTKKDINVYPDSQLLKRREELLDRIVDQDTNLPESILHEDLDMGMLDFVREKLLFSVNGNDVNFIDKILSTQRWAEMSANFAFVDKDKNIKLPFITVIRNPQVEYGSNPSLLYTIPDRQQFFYRKVPTFDGNRLGADIYKIPQPVPIDLSFNITIVCNRMRELNKFNKKMMQTFSSRQAYTTVNGHYIPIVLNSVTDESTISDNESRRYYQQTYTVQMQGFLIDEDEFEIQPAVSRNLVMLETGASVKGSSPVKITRTIKTNVEVDLVQFVGDGTTTTFRVPRKVKVLYYIDLNGAIQTQNTDYFHNGDSSNITFAVAPPQNSIILVSYSYLSDFMNEYGEKLVLQKESYEFIANTYDYNTTYPIEDIVYVEVSGLIQLEGDYYNYTKGSNTLNVNQIPPLTGGPIKFSIVYLRKV